MKKNLLTLGLTALMAVGLVSCGSGNGGDNPVSTPAGGDTPTSSTTASGDLTLEPGALIYQDKVLYDLSVEGGYNLAFKADITGNITKIQIGSRNTTDTSEFSYKDGVVIISKSFMSKVSARDGEIVITTDSGTKRIPAMICNKIIKTAQEFQDINENLSGFYALGGDIDLSTIENFEPLGYYFGSETNPKNEYFHGVLEGNGYTVKNAQVFWCTSYSDSEWDSQDVINTGSLFESEAHTPGDNIGLFQIIGSSGIVRNTTFKNIRVKGRTIVGVIAGNNSGTIENCIVDSDCRVIGGTHFYDNDCNIAGVVGINAASGVIRNTISLTANIKFPSVFIDHSPDYVGKIGNGWDHPASVTNDDWWKYANIDRPLMNYSSGSAVDSGSKEHDSNGHLSNGIYAFCGKSWGLIENSYSIAFNYVSYEAGATRAIDFAQTHLGSVKPGSGETNMGTLTNCLTKTTEELKAAALYSTFDSNIWNITDGELPTFKAPIYTWELAA